MTAKRAEKRREIAKRLRRALLELQHHVAALLCEDGQRTTRAIKSTLPRTGKTKGSK